jgi:hypothetical protein
VDVGKKSGHPIAEKMVARMKREVRGKVVDLKSLIAGRAAAEELQRTVVTKESQRPAEYGVAQRPG